jgi:spermidine/putrescine transport system ATP-binding protein
MIASWLSRLAKRLNISRLFVKPSCVPVGNGFLRGNFSVAMPGLFASLKYRGDSVPGETAAIEVENLVRRFGDMMALDHVSVTIRKGEFFSLLGPSGCGKTTLLRIIGGLDIADEGIVRIDGTDASAIPAHRRPVNTVFQSYALFPHMTVADNIAFGLRMKKVPKPEIADRVKKVMDMVEIPQLAGRKPAQLSGGQKQRVALARAIVNEPSVLLLDEPLGALDLKLRKQLQVELLTIQRRVGITFVYVTHDQEEALVMSDRIAVMNTGRIVQMGDAEDLYEHPRTRYVSQFLGSCNLLDATVRQRSATGGVVDTPVGELRVESGKLPDRDKLTLAIRPEKVNMCAPGECAGENRFKVKVEQLIYIGSETHYVLRAGHQTLTAEAMNVKVGSQGFDIGADAIAYLPAAGLLVLDD